MRVLMTVALVVALALAGCSDKKKGDSHEHETYQCPNGGPLLEAEDFPDHDNESFELSEQCPGEDDDDDNGGNSTPNQAPVLALKVFDAPGGNETNVTMVDERESVKVEGSLTFSAEGSSDPDGSVSGIAVTVTDSNQTRTLPLFAAGRFVPATFSFDRAGVVNVTVAAVDDRAGFTIETFQVYVNSLQLQQSKTFAGANNENVMDPADCENTAGGALVDAVYWDSPSITVNDNATWIEVSSSGTNVQYAICSPDPDGDGAEPRAALSDATTGSTTTKPEFAPLPPSLDYKIWAVSQAPQAQVDWTIVVHYEPRPAA